LEPNFLRKTLQKLYDRVIVGKYPGISEVIVGEGNFDEDHSLNMKIKVVFDDEFFNLEDYDEDSPDYDSPLHESIFNYIRYLCDIIMNYSDYVIYHRREFEVKFVNKISEGVVILTWDSEGFRKSTPECDKKIDDLF